MRFFGNQLKNLQKLNANCVDVLTLPYCLVAQKLVLVEPNPHKEAKQKKRSKRLLNIKLNKQGRTANQYRRFLEKENKRK
jgi:hypothetical protein